MVNDPIGDMIIQIKNAGLANRKRITLPFSKVKFKIAGILHAEGYLDKIDVSGDEPKKLLNLNIKYYDNKPVITDVKRKSKPGLRIYINKLMIKRVVGGMGISLISTSQGIMTGSQARKNGIGGELLFEIW
jgi:small subunit ribosomal protein S8